MGGSTGRLVFRVLAYFFVLTVTSAFRLREVPEQEPNAPWLLSVSFVAGVYKGSSEGRLSVRMLFSCPSMGSAGLSSEVGYVFFYFIRSTGLQVPYVSVGLPSKLSKFVGGEMSAKAILGCSVESSSSWQGSTFLRAGMGAHSSNEQLKCSSGMKHVAPVMPSEFSVGALVGSTTPFPKVACSYLVFRRLLTGDRLAPVPRKCSRAEAKGGSYVSTVVRRQLGCKLAG